MKVVIGYKGPCPIKSTWCNVTCACGDARGEEFLVSLSYSCLFLPALFITLRPQEGVAVPHSVGYKYTAPVTSQVARLQGRTSF